MKTYSDYCTEYDSIIAPTAPKCAYVTFHFLEDNGITSEPWESSFSAELQQALSRFPEADQTDFAKAIQATIDLTTR